MATINIEVANLWIDALLSDEYAEDIDCPGFLRKGEGQRMFWTPLGVLAEVTDPDLWYLEKIKRSEMSIDNDKLYTQVIENLADESGIPEYIIELAGNYFFDDGCNFAEIAGYLQELFMQEFQEDDY